MENQDICQSSIKIEKAKQIVAAFDFDGTITTRDSLPYFLKFSSGTFLTIIKLIQHIPKFVLCLLKRTSRQQVKESLLKSFFKGDSIDSLRIKGKKFAEGPLLHLVKDQALKKLQYHLKAGHRCVLISANLDVYLDFFASHHGFQDCICSKVESDENGLVTGRLEGLNCIGIEKVHRLKKLFGEKNQYILYAYGNSEGDKELLNFSDYSYYRTFD